MLPSLSRLVVFCESVYWTVTVHGQSVIIKSDEWGREREIAMWSKDESLESVSELYNGLHVIYAWCRHVFIISWGPDSLKNPMKPFFTLSRKKLKHTCFHPYTHPYFTCDSRRCIFPCSSFVDSQRSTLYVHCPIQHSCNNLNLQ